MVRDDNAEVISNDLDVLFVVDNTISMIAEDYNGDNTRLSAVKEDIKHIVEELEGAKFSIVTKIDFGERFKRINIHHACIIMHNKR